MAGRASGGVICMSGDSGVIRENCALYNIEFPFEQDFYRLRPFLEKQGVDVTQYSSRDLYKLTQTVLSGHTHDALHDCRNMAAWLADAKKQKVFTNISDLTTEVPKVDPRSNTQG